MKFDIVIGNPPYQEEDENRSEQPPVYHLYYELACALAPVVTLITPARFLFDVGKTPTEWNQKMLNDPHFKVVSYHPNSQDIFPSVDIKGGVAIGLRDCMQNFGAMGKYLPNDFVKSIYQTVAPVYSNSLATFLFSSTSYQYSQQLEKDFMDIRKKYLAKPKPYIASPDLERYPEFFLEQPLQNDDCIQILGRVGGGVQHDLSKEIILNHTKI
ncbi:MAG: Eco57I restriction-modification methylase domain-containing protein [Firmicutes bacterium]|nr:Eco57I restriction-modification methylase domain-containing protein [Bacillota bacterium]